LFSIIKLFILLQEQNTPKLCRIKRKFKQNYYLEAQPRLDIPFLSDWGGEEVGDSGEGCREAVFSGAWI